MVSNSSDAKIQNLFHNNKGNGQKKKNSVETTIKAKAAAVERDCGGFLLLAGVTT